MYAFGVLALAALVTFGVVLATRNGIGTSPDSAVYLGTAENLLTGNGLTVPVGDAPGGALTRFPPLYPLVLAGIGAVGAPLSHAGRLVAGLSFVGLILVVDGISTRMSMAGLIAACLIAVSPPIHLIHTMAWSEGLFLLLAFAGLLCLSRAIEQNDRLWFWLSVGAMALACLTRYAGLAFVFAGATGVFLWGGPDRRSRLRRSLTYAGASSLPVLLWTGWMASTSSGIGGREIGVHWVGRVQVEQAVGTLAGWLLLPMETPGWVKLSIVGLCTAALIGVVWLYEGPGRKRREGGRPGDGERPIALRLLALTVVTYSLFLILVVSFLDANTPMDDRLLSPVLVVAIVLAAKGFGWAYARGGMPARLAILILIPAVALYGVRSLGLIGDGYTHGIGFGREEWRKSETIARVRDLPEARPIYSDSPEAVYLLTGRAAYRWPRQFLTTGRKVNDLYAEQLAGIARQLGRSGGAVVDFDQVGPEIDVAGLVSLAPKVTDTADGRIYEFETGG